MGAMSCMLFSSPHWNPTVLDSIDHNPKGNDPLYFSLTAMPIFWHLKIIKAISIESCIEILTSLGRSPPSTNESFLTKFWLSKYFGNNSSVFTAVMGDRMEERGECFSIVWLSPGDWLLGTGVPKAVMSPPEYLRRLTSSGHFILFSLFPDWLEASANVLKPRQTEPSKKCLCVM